MPDDFAVQLPEQSVHPDCALSVTSGVPEIVAADGTGSAGDAAGVWSRSPAAGQVGDSDALRILLQASAAAESLQQRFTELQQRRAELTAEHQQLEADRRAFENRAREFAASVAQDRAAQREMQAELEQRLTRAAEQETLLERQTVELRAAQRALSEERVILKGALKAELDEERRKLEQQRLQLEADRQQLIVRREQDRNEHSARLQEVDSLLQAEKSRLAERVRQDLSSELTQLNREKREWRESLEHQQAELQHQAEEVQQQREAFGEQLEAEQKRGQEELDKRRQILITEQSNLQRRYRFQFEHLGRAREDLELEIRELRREQQLFRTERQQFSEQHRLRFHQLESIRQKLHEAESSLLRETRIVERTRTAALADLQRVQVRSQEERDAATRDIESRQRKLRQQESALAEMSHRLDERAQRLGRLRAELDRTQAEIQEQRLAIDEARAALARDPGGPEIARARLEQARGDVQSFFNRLKNQLNSERDKLELSAAEIAERQLQFRRDRAELEQWFAEREASVLVAGANSEVPALQETIHALQQQIVRVEERWKSERRDAERTIRELLDQLALRDMTTYQKASPGGGRRSGSGSAGPEEQSAVPGSRDAA